MPGRTPAELFLKRQIRTRFSLLKTELASRTEEKQAAQKRHHDRCGSSFRSFQEGDAVRIRSFRGGVEKWIQAKVLRRLGAVTYLIEEGQRQRTVHVDHMLPGQGNVETVSLSLSSPVAENVPPVPLDGALVQFCLVHQRLFHHLLTSPTQRSRLLRCHLHPYHLPLPRNTGTQRGSGVHRKD